MDYQKRMFTPVPSFLKTPLLKLILSLLGKNKTTHEKGHRAEMLAAWALRLKGFTILERRYKNKLGEIDLIARRRDLLIFVEVKCRSTITQGLEAIQFTQRRRIERAAQLYLRRYKRTLNRLRFDAVIVTPTAWPRHYPNIWRMDD